jgi:hypothetical protein
MELRKFIATTIRDYLNEQHMLHEENKNQYYLIFKNQSKDTSTIYDVVKETDKYVFLTNGIHDFRVDKKTLSVKGIKNGKDGYSWDLPKAIALEKVQIKKSSKTFYQKNLDLINSNECIKERLSFPKYLLDEIGIDDVLTYLIIEDSRVISRDLYNKFKEEPPQRDDEDILDYIKRKSDNRYTWQQIEKKLIYNYSLWLTREIPKEVEFSDLSEALKFCEIFTMKFTHGYIIPLIESYSKK